MSATFEPTGLRRAASAGGPDYSNTVPRPAACSVKGIGPTSGRCSVGSLSWCAGSDVGEDGEYAPVGVAVVGNVKFGEYVSDVCFDGAIADDEA